MDRGANAKAATATGAMVALAEFRYGVAGHGAI